MIDAYVGLGANLGDRMESLRAAVEQLAREPGFLLRGTSPVYETEPVGPPQPRYLNAVARIGTLLSPRATLRRLLEIEELLGRVRRERWGSHRGGWSAPRSSSSSPRAGVRAGAARRTGTGRVPSTDGAHGRGASVRFARGCAPRSAPRRQPPQRAARAGPRRWSLRQSAASTRSVSAGLLRAG